MRRDVDVDGELQRAFAGERDAGIECQCQWTARLSRMLSAAEPLGLTTRA